MANEIHQKSMTYVSLDTAMHAGIFFTFKKNFICRKTTEIFSVRRDALPWRNEAILLAEDVLSECSDICEEYSSRDDDDVIDYDDNINDPDYFLPSDHNNNNG